MPSTFAQSVGQALDSFTRPISIDRLDNPPHAEQHQDHHAAVEALEDFLVGPVFFNPLGRPFNATGSTVNDDAAAIQNAIEAASSVSGGVVVLSRMHRIDATLSVRPGVSFAGTGWHAGLKAGASMGSMLLTSANGSNVRFKNMTLNTDGNVAGQMFRPHISFSGLYVMDCRLLDVGTTVARDVMIPLAGANDILFSKCLIDGFNQLRIDKDSYNTRVLDCEFRNWISRAIFVVGTQAAGHPRGIWIERNYIHDHIPNVSSTVIPQPIAIQNSDTRSPPDRIRDVFIRDNVVVGSSVAQTSLGAGTADLISVHGLDGFVLDGNVARDGGDVGITVSQQVRNGVVSKNTCLNNDTDGIFVGNVAENIVVDGNVCVDNGQNRNGVVQAFNRSGIELTSATNVMVSGNVCGNSAGSTMQQYGVSIRGSTGVGLGVNMLLGNDQGPIFVSSAAHSGGTIPMWSTFSTSVGTTGGAAPPPATPARYLKVLVDPVPATTASTNATTLYIPAYNST